MDYILHHYWIFGNPHSVFFIQESAGNLWISSQGDAKAKAQQDASTSGVAVAREKWYRDETMKLRDFVALKKKLGGGFIFFFFHPRKLGRWSNLTNIFQMGWNHQLGVVCFCFSNSCLHPLTGCQKPIWYKRLQEGKKTSSIHTNLGKAHDLGVPDRLKAVCWQAVGVACPFPKALSPAQLEELKKNLGNYGPTIWWYVHICLYFIYSLKERERERSKHQRCWEVLVVYNFRIKEKHLCVGTMKDCKNNWWDAFFQGIRQCLLLTSLTVVPYLYVTALWSGNVNRVGE